jgi:hypothetical protein
MVEHRCTTGVKNVFCNPLLESIHYLKTNNHCGCDPVPIVERFKIKNYCAFGFIIRVEQDVY